MRELEALLEALAERVAEKVASRLRDEPKPEPPDPSLPVYLDTLEAANLLGMSRRGLEMLRWRGKGPPFLRIGRAIRYETRAVKAWLSRGPDL